MSRNVVPESGGNTAEGGVPGNGDNISKGTVMKQHGSLEKISKMCRENEKTHTGYAHQ